jgi:hypothetical protein
MTALFGTAVGCAALAVWAVVDWDEAFGPWLLAGAVLYLAGPVGLTMTDHVRDRLDVDRLHGRDPLCCGQSRERSHHEAGEREQSARAQPAADCGDECR